MAVNQIKCNSMQQKSSIAFLNDDEAIFAIFLIMADLLQTQTRHPRACALMGTCERLHRLCSVCTVYLSVKQSSDDAQRWPFPSQWTLRLIQWKMTIVMSGK